MNTLFLAPEELAELTGYKARHAQVRWLDRNRWRYALASSGEPKVARAHFDERMGCGPAATRHADAINQAAAAVQPNFAAVGRR